MPLVLELSSHDLTATPSRTRRPQQRSAGFSRVSVYKRRPWPAYPGSTSHRSVWNTPGSGASVTWAVHLWFKILSKESAPTDTPPAERVA